MGFCVFNNTFVATALFSIHPHGLYSYPGYCFFGCKWSFFTFMADKIHQGLVPLSDQNITMTNQYLLVLRCYYRDVSFCGWFGSLLNPVCH